MMSTTPMTLRPASFAGDTPESRLSTAVIIQACHDGTDRDLYRDQRTFWTAAEAFLFLSDSEGEWAVSRTLWAENARRDPVALTERTRKLVAPYEAAVREYLRALDTLRPLCLAVAALRREHMAILDRYTCWKKLAKDERSALAADGERRRLERKIERRIKVGGDQNKQRRDRHSQETRAFTAASSNLRSAHMAEESRWRSVCEESSATLAAESAALARKKSEAWGRFMDDSAMWVAHELPTDKDL